MDGVCLKGRKQLHAGSMIVDPATKKVYRAAFKDEYGP